MGNPELKIIKDKEQIFEVGVSDLELIKSVSKITKREQQNLIQTIFDLGLKVWKISNVEVDYQKLEDLHYHEQKHKNIFLLYLIFLLRQILLKVLLNYPCLQYQINS